MTLPTPPTDDYTVPAIISRGSLEQVIINRSIADAQFRQDLIADPTATLQSFMGGIFPEGMTARVYVEDANTFYYVTPNTDPTTGQYTTATASAPATMSLRASFVGRLNYLLSAPDTPPVDDLETAARNMAAADQADDAASIAARNAEIEAAQAGQQAEDAEIAYAEALAAAELLPDNPGVDDAVENARLAMSTAEHVYQLALATASSLRESAIQAAQTALEADGRYEDSLRVAFQQQFSQDPITALNTFLNLVTPFASSYTIYDTDPIASSPPSSPGGVCFTHLIETTGQVMFIVLPYTANHGLFMGPYSISFDGASSYIRVPASPTLNARNLFAVEAWVWSDDFRSGYNDVVLSSLTSDGGWQLEVGGGIPKFTVVLNGVSQSLVPSDPAFVLQTGKWHYVVGLFGNDKFALYVNGFQKAEITVNGAIAPGGDLLMGCDTSQSTASFFKGMIHEVRLWGDAITADVILGNIPLGATTIPIPLQQALLAHYVFDEGVGFNATDDSPNHNDGVMINAIWKITGQDSPA